MTNMSLSIKLPYCTIYRNKTISKKIEQQVSHAYQTNKKLYQRTVPRFKIIICDNEEEFKHATKYYYSPSSAGTALKDGTLIVRSQEFLNTTRKFFQEVLTHEMNHTFSNILYKGTTKPSWITEAIATLAATQTYFLSKNDTLQKNPTANMLHYRYMKKRFNIQRDKKILIYSVWMHFFHYATKGDLKKGIQFMEQYIKHPTRKHYDELFRKCFGKPPEKLFQDFLHNQTFL